MKTFVVIPTYNERQNITLLVEELVKRHPELFVLVVDDSSPDGTQEEVLRLIKEFPNTHLLVRPQKKGIGPAYLAGFEKALELGADRVIQMDADGSHSVNDLASLLEFSGPGKLVIGSRWVAGGSVVNWPLSRLAISKTGNTFGRLALATKVKDVTGGFRVHHHDALAEILRLNLTTSGYAFQIEVLKAHLQLGSQVVEVPIRFENRKLGNSKMSHTIAFEAGIWILRTWLLRLIGRG